MRNQKYKYGMSLIEILMAVFIVAVLATMVISVSSSLDNRSKEDGTKVLFSQLETALQEYYEYWNGFPDPNLAPYPTNSAALYGQLRSTPGTNIYLENINEKLIKNNPNVPVEMPQILEIYDPWGTLLDYKYIPGNAFPKLVSAGPDKVFGTVDDIQNK
ncbi:MAG: type II secretion system protein [Sedimentisphaerales bacterium]|nr:type II secretion system protein [Sedimentisphaerales bacterium]